MHRWLDRRFNTFEMLDSTDSQIQQVPIQGVYGATRRYRMAENWEVKRKFRLDVLITQGNYR